MPNSDRLTFFLEKYFSGELDEGQKNRFRMAYEAYLDWNKKINVISRKDIENLAERHFLHSLAIAKVISFTPGTRILDAGTGGGFPGVPLAICFPEAKFHLVDSRGKKITVVQEVVQAVGLHNVQSSVQRVEQLDGQYDFVVSRAVASLEKFVPWVAHQISASQHNSLPNGILYLRGGDIEAEIRAFRKKGLQWKIYPLSDFWEEEFFAEKSLVHIWWK